MAIRSWYLLLFVLLLSACQGEPKEKPIETQEDMYSAIFEDNYFRQLAYLHESQAELLSILQSTITEEEPRLVFWMKNGDCDSCIEQQIQFLKLILKEEKRAVTVFADYRSKRVFSSVQSSFDFVDMKLVKMPEELSDSVGSPFYIDYNKSNSTLSIYKPIPERASWTKRYLEIIGAL